MNDMEAKAELVQFAREEHSKLQAHIEELEQRNGKLRFRIEKAKGILKDWLDAIKDNCLVDELRAELKRILGALEGR